MKSPVFMLAAVGLMVVNSLLHIAHAQCVQCDIIQAWRDTLFYDLTSFPRVDSRWSRLLTFKENAHVVLRGKSYSNGILALATLGSGRIAAITNDRHVQNLGSVEGNKKIRKLHENLQKWLQNGATGTWGICKPTNSAELTQCLNDFDKTLLWVGGSWPTDADNDNVIEWINQGGTLVHGFDRVQFEEEEVESAAHIGLYKVLLEAGIAYEGEDAGVAKSVQVVDGHDAQELANLNLDTMAQSLTWDNIESNSRLDYVVSWIKRKHRYCLPEVSSHILRPFEAFAQEMEVNMIWPNATVLNRKSVPVTPRHFTMFKLYYALSMAHLWKRKAPNVHLFPGDIANPPARQTQTFQFLSRQYRYNYPTGLYLLPGDDMTISVNNAIEDNTWTKFKIYVGIYSEPYDVLTSDVSKIRRFPDTKRVVKMIARQMIVRWPFGGLVYVEAPDGVGKTLDVTISGAVPTPHLDVINEQDLDAKWAERCQNPGLVADIQGQYTRFTLPVVGGICNVNGERLKELMELWDTAVTTDYKLRGDPEDKDKQQAFTCDIQMGGGALHSGHPIVGWITYCLIDENKFYFNGNWGAQWGPYHELGHMVSHKMWTRPEITTNIWAYFQMERMAGHTWETLPKIKGVLKSNKLTTWMENPSWDGLTNSMHLMPYTQLIRDFGWGCQNDIFKGFKEDFANGHPAPNKTGVLDGWLERWSTTSGYNVCPLLRDFWQWPVSAHLCDDLHGRGLTPYLPDDDFTRKSSAAGLVGNVESLWGTRGLVRSITTVPPCSLFDIEPIAP